MFSPINTPGHLSDHLCFMIEEPGQETIMCSGDHIIGADTVNTSKS
jgi:glyoxylase-like metal-dependent hydrolase (beta-lactamase superfamily II)